MIASQLAKRKRGLKTPTIWRPIFNVQLPKGLFGRTQGQVGGNAAPSPINAVPPDTTSVQDTGQPQVTEQNPVKKKHKKKAGAFSNPLVIGGIVVGALVVIILVVKKKQQSPLERIQGYAKGVGSALSRSI